MSRSKSKQCEVEEEEVVESVDNSSVEVEDQASTHLIELLQEHGINATEIKKLKDAGIYTVKALTMRPHKQLCEQVKGMNEDKLKKFLAAANKVLEFNWVTGLAMLEKRKNIAKISTGCDELNNLLGGGIESHSITEAFGEFRTGKTQLAHTLCVTAQLPRESGGGNGKVIFIDTEGTFRAERIVQIAERFGVDGEAVLENILVARVFTHEAQMELLTKAAASMIDDKFALIVVDSCTALFRVDFMGRGQLADRQQKLGQFLSTLTKIAEEFGVAAYITNQVVSDPSGGMHGPGIVHPKPIGGHIMAHSCCTRLFLRKGRAGNMVCKIYDSPCLPEAEAMYSLSDGGISAAKDA